MKQQKAIIILLICALTFTTIVVTGYAINLFYFFLGEEAYLVTCNLYLSPVYSSMGVIDVNVWFDSSLEKVRVPHEIYTHYPFDLHRSGQLLWTDQHGSFTLTLTLELLNFTGTVFTKTLTLNQPLNYTFNVYRSPTVAVENTILQLMVDGTLTLRLDSLRNPETQTISYMEKFQV